MEAEAEEQTVQVLSRVDCITCSDYFVYYVFAKGEGCTALLKV